MLFLQAGPAEFPSAELMGRGWMVSAHPDKLQLPLARWQLKEERQVPHLCKHTEGLPGAAGKQDNEEGKRQNSALKNSNLYMFLLH